ncbi:GNAT family N-acetyltransferase [Clostridium butanoliproducens]|uniref:GNAT family N-acetyltransferase n=1 Tax=Clostridium butanoliproducens TaxID=2991837 RepID=UPI0024BBDD74|nr:GNAT family N-acetyltransferase [Clostridium butanoliproducens]
MSGKDIKILNVNEKSVSQAKNLIVRSLCEYFHSYDSSMNPDLDNILRFYGDEKSTFLVAVYNDKVIGTGALIEETDSIARIVRMSVDNEYRKLGIGTKILYSLEQTATDRNYSKVVLETTKTWETAKSFYLSNGYIEEYEDEENVHFFKLIR